MRELAAARVVAAAGRPRPRTTARFILVSALREELAVFPSSYDTRGLRHRAEHGRGPGAHRVRCVRQVGGPYGSVGENADARTVLPPAPR
jgi:hypothetical protein